MAGCWRRPQPNAERTVSLQLEAELARCEEVFCILVPALTFPIIVNALVPVAVRVEEAGSPMQARDQGGYVLVGVHRHAKRLSVFHVELSVQERVRQGQRVNRAAANQRTQMQLGRLAESFDRVSNPNRVGLVF